MNKIIQVFLILFISAFNTIGLNADIISYFPFEDDFVDSETGLTAQSQNVTFDFGKFGKAARFTSANGGGYVSFDSNFHSLINISASFWLHTLNSSSGGIIDVGRFRLEKSNNDLRIYVYSSLDPYTALTVYEDQGFFTDKNFKWNHLSVSVDPQMNLTVYVNGSIYEFTATTSYNGDFRNKTIFGAILSINYYATLTGLLDDIIIYDHILTEEEVLASMTEGANGPYIVQPNISTLSLGENLSIQLEGNNIDTYELVDPVEGMVVDPNTGLIEMNYSYMTAGDIYNVVVHGYQSSEHVATTMFDLEVVESKPTIETIPNKTILKNIEFVYQIIVNELNGLGYEFNIETSPENSNIDISPAGELTWTPINSGIAQEVTLVVVSQDEEVSDPVTFTLTVTEMDQMNLDFNDAAWTDQLVFDFIFGDKDSVSVFDSKWVGTDDLVTFNTNGTGGTVLKFNPGENADLNSHISTPDYAIARDRILIESRVKLPQIKETDTLTLLRFISQEDLGKSISFNLGRDSSNNLIPLLNYSGTDDYIPSTLIQNWQDKFERLGLEIWINRSNSPATYHAQFYHNDSELGDVININDLSWPSVNDFFVAITDVESLKRNFNDAGFEVDFIRVKQLDAPYQTGINGDSYEGEVFVTDSSTISVVLDGNRIPGADVEGDYFMIKRLSNSPSEITTWNNNPSDASPDYENENTVFHGIFQINFGLVAADFLGTVDVDIFISVNSGAYKQIGTKTVSVDSSAPNNIDWHEFYWNSREPFNGGGADNWSSDDSNAQQGTAELKFELR